MKKVCIYICFLMLLMFVGTNCVFADDINENVYSLTCKYGKMDVNKDPKNRNWEHYYTMQLVIQKADNILGSYATFNILFSDSPRLKNSGSGWTQKNPEYPLWYSTSFFSNDIESGYAAIKKTSLTSYLYTNSMLQILIETEPIRQVFKNDEEYKKAIHEHYCSPTIFEEVKVQDYIALLSGNSLTIKWWDFIDASWDKAVTINLYSSNMQLSDLNESNAFEKALKGAGELLGIYKQREASKVLYEESAKDMDKDLLDTDCSTFNTYFSGIRNAKYLGGNKCDGNSLFEKRYLELVKLCDDYRESSHYSTKDSNGNVVAKSCSTACSKLYSKIDKLCGKTKEDASCGSLGNKLVRWIFKIVKFVRYAVPALLIILSIIDYIKAIAADSEDEMKKVISRFSKRLIAAALIFIIPFVLEFIINIFSLPGLDPDNLFCA